MIKEESEDDQDHLDEDSDEDSVFSNSEDDDRIQRVNPLQDDGAVEGEHLFDYIHDYIGVDMAEDQDDSLIYDDPFESHANRD